MQRGYIGRPLSRRFLLGQAGVAGLAFATAPAWAQAMIDLVLPGGPDARPITTAFPQKAAMILQRSRPPLLETPFEVFDNAVFTPNSKFFVRWHWAVIPTKVDVAAFKLAVRGHVNQTLSLSMADVLAMPRSSWRPSISARAIPAASSSRACQAANGRTGQWETRSGRCLLARRAGSRGRQGRGRCGSLRRSRRAGCGRSTRLHEIARRGPCA
jgi:hypothetical protein